MKSKNSHENRLGSIYVNNDVTLSAVKSRSEKLYPLSYAATGAQEFAQIRLEKREN